MRSLLVGTLFGLAFTAISVEEVEAQNPMGFCEDCLPTTATCVWLSQGYNGCRDAGSGGGYCSTIPYDFCGPQQEIAVAPSGVVDTGSAAAYVLNGVAYGGCRSWIVGLAMESGEELHAGTPGRIVI